ncbi:MAG: triphosphoribosyl-dephospho-CoA synthase, partial [Clostridia bacterium]|nr:triphosphoribosyl-dephospho-CoA synthase [Clostridia bacterium]
MCRKEEISQMAVKSMVYEVNATPKPGLVDKRNSGAHDDMDYNLFIKSAVSFADCLNEIVEIGYTYTGDNY